MGGGGGGGCTRETMDVKMKIQNLFNLKPMCSNTVCVNEQ